MSTSHKIRRMKEQKLTKYFYDWVAMYKEGQVTDITLSKYLRIGKFLEDNFPNLVVGTMTRRDYQMILNTYAKTRERQTVMDFHHQLKATMKDALYEGVIKQDVTYNAVVKGVPPSKKKPKFISQEQLKALLATLDLGDHLMNKDWLLYFIAKTGARFAEALAVTPADFDFENNTVSINKTWNYKASKGRFEKTKTLCSVRTIPLDWALVSKLFARIKDLPANEPIFINPDVSEYNSIYNQHIARKCAQADIPVISVHGLRHTHASILLANNVSVYSVSKRLGHAKVSITQDVYAHITDELDDKDNSMMTGVLSAL